MRHEPVWCAANSIAEKINRCYFVFMKTTIDIPDKTFIILSRLTKATTKRDAIMTAVEEYNRRHEVAALKATFGSWQMDSNENIEATDLEEAGKKL